MSLYRVLKERGVQYTDRLTQKKCQVTMTTSCSGEKSPLILLSRSGNEWLQKLGWEGPRGYLKASVGDDPTIPPTTGWKFYNSDTDKYEEDPQLMCSISPASSACNITVSLKGLAKDIQGDCEGEYLDTGMRSAGRKVINFSM